MELWELQKRIKFGAMLQLPVAQSYLFLEIGVSNRLKLICFLLTEKGATLLAGDCLMGLGILRMDVLDDLRERRAHFITVKNVVGKISICSKFQHARLSHLGQM